MPRGRGDVCSRLEQSLETGDKDSFVPTVQSHEDVAGMWEWSYAERLKCKTLEERLQALEEELGVGTEVGLVLSMIDDRSAIVTKRGMLHRVSLARDGGPAVAAHVGSAVLLDKTDHFVLDVLGDYRWAPDVGHLNYVHDDRLQASVTVNSREHIMTLRQGLGDNGDLAAGARVVCSITDRFVQERAPQQALSVPYEALYSIPDGYGLKGIGPAIRQRLEREIIGPLTAFEPHAHQGWNGRFVMTGPTGTGKSFAVDQTASRVPGVALLRRWPSQFRHSLFGASEQAVRQLCDQMLALSQRGPVIVVLEEADVYLSRRAEVWGSSVARTELAIESEFFRLLDSIPDDRPVALIVTTNMRNIEPAILRRFGNHELEFEYLGPAEVEEIVEHLLMRRPEWLDGDPRQLVRRTVERLCDRTEPLFSAVVDGAKREWVPADLVSPSLTTSVISAAINDAISRGLESGDGPAHPAAPRIDWPLLATHIHRGYSQLVRIISRDNLHDYVPEVHERRVGEVTATWPQQEPVEAYLAA